VVNTHDTSHTERGVMVSSVPVIEKSEQCVKYGSDIRQIFNNIISSGAYTISDMTSFTHVAEHTLQQFLSRSTELPRYSHTLHMLYKLIVGEIGSDRFDWQRIDSETLKLVSTIQASYDNITNTDVVYKLFIQLMDSSFNKIDKVGKKFNGVFYIYRYSIIKSETTCAGGGIIKIPRLVKTRLEIFLPTESGKMWQFIQYYQDKIGTVRSTTGVMLTLSSNVYCLGRIEDGFGIDIIVFSEPLESKEGNGIQELTQALVMSLDTKKQPVVSRAVIKYARQDRDQWIGPRDITDEIRNEIKDFEQYMDNPSDRDRPLTLNAT
jgi:hypothetical protein